MNIPVSMPAEMIAFLEDLSLRSRIGGGKRLDNTEIVRAAVRFLMESGANVKGCLDEDDVLDAIKRSIRQ